MSILLEKQMLTPEAYLAREAAKSLEERKSEYFDGQIYDMPIASYFHEKIAGNFFAVLWILLRRQGYEVFKSDLKVKLNSDRYALPDILVVKGKAQFSPDEFYNLVNPYLIIEVLSDGTEAKDRGKKFRAYKETETLQEYILVSQYEYAVECYYRDENNHWIIGDYYTSPDAVVKFKSIPFEIAVKDIYEGVEFGADK